MTSLLRPHSLAGGCSQRCSNYGAVLCSTLFCPRPGHCSAVIHTDKPDKPDDKPSENEEPLTSVILQFQKSVIKSQLKKGISLHVPKKTGITSQRCIHQVKHKIEHSVVNHPSSTSSLNRGKFYSDKNTKSYLKSKSSSPNMKKIVKITTSEQSKFSGTGTKKEELQENSMLPVEQELYRDSKQINDQRCMLNDFTSSKHDYHQAAQKNIEIVQHDSDTWVLLLELVRSSQEFEELKRLEDHVRSVYRTLNIQYSIYNFCELLLVYFGIQ